MTQYDNAPELKASLLGKETAYASEYDANLLYPIARKLNRDELNIIESELPFKGEDTWTGFELSWLNPKGKPVVAVAEFVFPCQSSHIIESKSFKLYLNSFNQTRFASTEDVKATLIRDLSKGANAEVEVRIYSADDFNCLPTSAMPGICIDDLDIDIDSYELNPNLLKVESSEIVTETLHSHLLKSNCLITSQPDWASVVIRYTGPKLDHANLLRYLISFRDHNEFHEQCVERLFTDIQKLGMQALEVYARYTRRGGLDINPYRSTHHDRTQFKVRINRQ